MSTAKSDALNNLKMTIKSRLHSESQSNPINERIKNNSLRIVAKARHERRHGQGTGTSKSQALKTFASYSKDS